MKELASVRHLATSAGRRVSALSPVYTVILPAALLPVNVRDRSLILCWFLGLVSLVLVQDLVCVLEFGLFLNWNFRSHSVFDEDSFQGFFLFLRRENALSVSCSDGVDPHNVVEEGGDYLRPGFHLWSMSYPSVFSKAAHDLQSSWVQRPQVVIQETIVENRVLDL